MKVKWTYSCIFQNVTIGLGLYLCLKRRYRFFLKPKKKFRVFFFAKKSKFKPKKFKIKHKPKKFKIEHKPRKFKIKHNILSILTYPENSKSNTCSKIQELKLMNLLLFNKSNPNQTLNPFKEHKSTSSRTQIHLNISTISAIELHKFKHRSNKFKIRSQFQIKT